MPTSSVRRGLQSAQSVPSLQRPLSESAAEDGEQGRQGVGECCGVGGGGDMRALGEDFAGGRLRAADLVPNRRKCRRR